jgi:hypothetical protein
MKSFGKIAIISSIIAALIIPTAAEAKSYNPHHGPTHTIKGYTKKNGTYVSPYQRTKAKHTKSDNLYID